jgi:8-oxo-dGTP diphosphatase
MSVDAADQPDSYHPSDYPRFAVTADVVLFAEHVDGTHVLLVRRAEEPFQGRWALPGGFVHVDEDLPDAARRELAEETGVEVDDLRQLGAYGSPGRDPRMRVVTVVFWAEIDSSVQHKADGDASDTRFWPVSSLLADPDLLGFDHHRILEDAVSDLGGLH